MSSALEINSPAWASVGWGSLLLEVCARTSSCLCRAIQEAVHACLPLLQRRRMSGCRSRRGRSRRALFRDAFLFTKSLSVVLQWLDHGGKADPSELRGASVGDQLWVRLFPQCLRACKERLWGGLSLDKRGRLRALAERVLGAEDPEQEGVGSQQVFEHLFQEGPGQGPPLGPVGLDFPF